jgi:DNA-binding transcriptional MerR regulator
LKYYWPDYLRRVTLVGKKRRGSPNGFTIEELSFRSGVTTRSIRDYQTRGLLPPPQLRAGQRSAFYEPEHLARLRVIGRMQERGHSLEGIKKLLEALDSGKTLQQLLGVESAVAEVSADHSVTMSESEFRQKVPKEMDADALIQMLRQAGLLVREGEQLRVPYPDLLRLGTKAAASGMPLNALLMEYSRISRDVNGIAKRCVALFMKFVAEPYNTAGLPADRLTEYVDSIKSLRVMAAGMIESMVARALDEQIEAASLELTPKPEETP